MRKDKKLTHPIQVIYALSAGYFLAQSLALIPKSWKLYDFVSRKANQHYREFYDYWIGGNNNAVKESKQS